MINSVRIDSESEGDFHASRRPAGTLHGAGTKTAAAAAAAANGLLVASQELDGFDDE